MLASRCCTMRTLLACLRPAATPPLPTYVSGNARPVVTVVPLRPPVVAQDGVVAPLEADLIR